MRASIIGFRARPLCRESRRICSSGIHSTEWTWRVLVSGSIGKKHRRKTSRKLIFRQEFRVLVIDAFNSRSTRKYLESILKLCSTFLLRRSTLILYSSARWKTLIFPSFSSILSVKTFIFLHLSITFSEQNWNKNCYTRKYYIRPSKIIHRTKQVHVKVRFIVNVKEFKVHWNLILLFNVILARNAITS